VWVAILSISCIVGCDADDDGGGGDDGDDGPGMLTEDEALAELIRVRCDLARYCRCLDDKGYEDCVEFVGVAWGEVQTFAESSDATYRPENAAEIVDAIEQMVCVGDGQFPYELYSRASRNVLGHRPVYGGDLELGETCHLLSQLFWLHVDTCAEGLVCGKLDLNGQGTCETRVASPGTLPLALGDGCRAQDPRGFCPEGSHCDLGSETCVERSAEGEPCLTAGGLPTDAPLSLPSYDYGCAFGLYCDLDGDTCEALPGEGEPCVDFSAAAMYPTEPRCEPGLRCGVSGMCLSPTAKLGEMCANHDACPASGICDGGTCMPADPGVCYPA